MSSDYKNLTRDRIMNKIRENNKQREAAKEANKPKPEELFLDDDATTTASTDAVWYSDVFNAKDWLDRNKKPDLDISSLICDDSEWTTDDRNKIPELDSHYVWQHHVLYPIVMGQLVGMKSLTVGDTGTGKALGPFCRYLAQADY